MNNLLRKSCIALLSVSTVLLGSCSNAEKWTDEEFNGFETTHYVKKEEVVMNENDYHTPTQKAFIESTWDCFQQFGDGRYEKSIPLGMQITKNTNDKYVEVAENADFTNSRVFDIVQNDDGKDVVENLLSNKKYYYRTGENATGFTGDAKSFTTSNLLPRNLHIDGSTNFRDLGGYESKLGGTIKQNMYFRGAALNRVHDGKLVNSVTDIGYKALTQTLGVKTEIDLRNTTIEDDGTCENGGMDNSTFKELNYFSVPMSYERFSNMMNLGNNANQIRDVFKIYANKENYPIYIHCSIGTDRTGLISYLMGALLGMDNESLHTDYLFSNLGKIRQGRSGYVRDIRVIQEYYYPTLTSFKKATLQKCTEAYLLSIGVTKAEIQSIKDIMIVK